jgi:hypothetical protein
MYYTPQRSHLTFLIISATLLRVIIALINSYLFSTPGAGYDALGFDDTASHLANTGEMDSRNMTYTTLGKIYAIYLSFMYKFFVDSMFFGCLLSIAAWLISVLLSIRLLDHLNIKLEYIFIAVACFLFLPSSVTFTSLTLRESYQMLFITLMVYSMIRFNYTKSALHFFLIFLWAFLAAYLHRILPLVTVGAIGLYFTYQSLINLNNPAKKLRTYILLLGIISLILFSSSVLNAFGFSLDKGFFTLIIQQQVGLLGDGDGARSFYRQEAIDIDSFFELLYFFPQAFIQYFIEPTPWKWGSLMDIILSFENLLRIVFIFLTTYYLFFSEDDVRLKKTIGLIFILYIFIEFIWSIGTINWGTAARHHLPAINLLLICSAPALSFFFRSENLRHSSPEVR